MRFRKVGAEVWPVPPAVFPGRRRPDHDRHRPAGAVGRRNRDLVLSFIAAWTADDRAAMSALTASGLICRWVGFDRDPVASTGLPEVLAHGRAFERRHGIAQRHTVVESMGGLGHAAVLFEPDAVGWDIDHGVRIAVYRIEDDRITTVAVYADRLD